jgi:phosphoribosylanthranilate isomerase
VLERILSYIPLFSPFSDYFLIDTLRVNQSSLKDQPVAGFVGITGEVCDWTISARIVTESPLPVILAGGIGEDNVYDGIMTVRPAGVDSCTKTNAVDATGCPIRFKKDLQKVKRMVSEARKAASDTHNKA